MNNNILAFASVLSIHVLYFWCSINKKSIYIKERSKVTPVFVKQKTKKYTRRILTGKQLRKCCFLWVQSSCHGEQLSQHSAALCRPSVPRCGEAHGAKKMSLKHYKPPKNKTENSKTFIQTSAGQIHFEFGVLASTAL